MLTDCDTLYWNAPCIAWHEAVCQTHQDWEVGRVNAAYKAAMRLLTAWSKEYLAHWLREIYEASKCYFIC